MIQTAPTETFSHYIDLTTLIEQHNNILLQLMFNDRPFKSFFFLKFS